MVHNRWGARARGGAERVVERLVDALRARGHVVEVYCRTTGGFNALGRIPAILRAGWHLVDVLNVYAASRLRATLRRVRPDIIHTHNLVGCGGLTPWVIRRSGIPWVHTLHDVQLVTPSGLLVRDQPQSLIERSMFGRMFRACRRRLFGSPTTVTSPSRWLLALHRGARFFPKSGDAVVGNPIDTVPAPMRAPSPAIRRLLFLGQVEGVKGILVLVEAYRQLRALFPDVTLHIAGGGSAYELLKRMARDIRGLTIRGRLPHDAVAHAIAAADVLVVPSFCAENQPSVILEAFAMGVPVVASRVGGIPDLVRDGVTGFLVDPGSVDDLVRVLRACVEDPPRVREMSTACRAAARVHAVDTVASQIEMVYTQAAHQQHAYGGDRAGTTGESLAAASEREAG